MRSIYLICGFAATGLGILGIPLPILPTTPFLLVALWCFTRSSPRMRRWLLENKYFGHYLTDYTSKKGVERGVKAWALTVLWCTIGASAIWATDKWWVRAVLVAVAAAVTIHILMLKTLKKNE